MQIKKLFSCGTIFEKTILAKVPRAKIIAHKEKRLGNTSAVFMPGLTAETQVMAFDLAGIAVSAGLRVRLARSDKATSSKQRIYR